MAEVDTSSYPKPQQTNFLDTAQKYQSLEQGKLGIDQTKLKLANDQLTALSKGVSALIADPSVDGQKVAQQAQYMAKQLGIPDQLTNNFISQFPTNGTPDQIRTGLQKVLSQAQTTQEMINLHYGVPGAVPNGQGIQPVVTSPKPGFGMRATGLPIQQNPPSTAETVDNDPNSPTYGQKRMQGPTAPQGTSGSVAMPPPAPGFNLPVARPPSAPNPIPGPSSNFGNVTGVDVQNSPLPTTPVQQVQNRFPGPSGPTTGMPPLFEEGKKAYTSAQLNAATKAQALKPLIQSLPLIESPGFLSGPLTDQFTKAVATLKSTGLIDIKNENDPTAIRQEAVKKLAQYVSNSPVGMRSDNAQLLKEASSPNPSVQILPALVKLAKDQIALDRVEIILPNAFKGRDYHNFIKHQGSFPQSVDERALSLDLETPEKRKQIIDNIKKDLNSKDITKRKAAEKFSRTLELADQSGSIY